MTQRLTLIAVWIAFLVTAAGALAKEAAPASEGPRVALVIGNGAYAEAPIESAVSNARAVADVLRMGGFDVVYLENANKADIAEAVRIIADKMERGASAVVYYTGHVVQFDGRNFLIPVDFNINSQAEIRTQGFDADLLLDPLIVRRSAGSVVILDASRPNPWSRLLPGRPRGLAAQEPARASVSFTPQVLERLQTENFSSELIKAMKTPGLGFDAIISHARTAVSRTTGKQQLVWESSRASKRSRSSCRARRRRGLLRLPMRSKSAFGKQFRTVHRQLITKSTLTPIQMVGLRQRRASVLPSSRHKSGV